jgi:predicted membrane-bound spermidine synthase
LSARRADGQGVREPWYRRRAVLYVVFLVSGFAALLYQIVWQRALYAIYGINIESVTMVVTAFMLGLGIGSVTGGAVSKNPKRPALLLFSLVELGIGAFGFFSLPLFYAVGRATLHMPPLGTAFVTFLLVLGPTMLMGGTLPLLVGHLVRASRNVGKSVGMLYFVNTLGSALASFAAPLALLGSLGQSSTVKLAAALNVAVSVGAYLMYRRRAAQPSATDSADLGGEAEGLKPERSEPA